MRFTSLAVGLPLVAGIVTAASIPDSKNNKKDTKPLDHDVLVKKWTSICLAFIPVKDKKQYKAYGSLDPAFQTKDTTLNANSCGIYDTVTKKLTDKTKEAEKQLLQFIEKERSK